MRQCFRFSQPLELLVTNIDFLAVGGDYHFREPPPDSRPAGPPLTRDGRDG
jgi:hypothetical protein